MTISGIDCQALLLDLDGVLVDSTACVERHWREWASRHGRDAEAILRVAHGRRTVETLELMAPEVDIPAEVAALAASEAVDLRGVQVIAGAGELLDALPPGRWAVVTSGTDDVARARLRHCGLPIPDLLVTAGDVECGKPAPDAYLLAAGALGRTPDECVVLEDAPAGIASAHAAGMRVIALTTTHTVVDLAAADAVVQHLSQIEVARRDHGIELLVREPPVR